MRWTALFIAAFLLAPATASAQRVEHAKVWYYTQPHSYDETSKTLTLNYRHYSNNRRCIDKYAISDVDVVLYFEPDQEYATGDGPFTNLVQSQSFTLTRVGLGHYSIRLPGTQNVPTLNPNGSYGGTYSLESWWRAWTGPNHATWRAYAGSRIDINGRRSNDTKNLVSGPARRIVYYERKNGKRIKHTVLCGRPFKKDVDT
jgi:hypothetical protein